MREKEEEDEFLDVEFVKWFSELNKDSVSVAGGKGANLGEMYNIKIPVPPGFVVSAQAYDYFIEKAGIKKEMKKILDEINYNDTKQLDDVTRKIREMIVSSEFPEEMRREIIHAYEKLGSDDMRIDEIKKRISEGVFVAVRSSATAEDLADASFAGQQETYLNIKGNDSLIDAIKKCFASLYTSRATYYRQRKGFKHEETKLAVVVQKMIDSDKSGVIFSKDPSYNNENIIIEAVFGLGEGIVSGMITPDKYIVSPELKILDVKIADKKVAITRNSGGENIKVNLTEEKSASQVLKESEIKKLSEIALNLEEHYDKPQDIEFAVENGEIFIVQTRAITTMAKRIEKSKTDIEGDVILEGLAASPGIASGKVKIVRTIEDLEKIISGDVLVTKMTNPDMVVTMQKSSAIITDEGGLTAHAAIVSREMGIPCIVGTQEATAKLTDGEIVTVDGFRGKVYSGKVGEETKKEIEKVIAKTKTKIKVTVDLPTFAERASRTGLNSVGLLRIEGIIAESGKHPDLFLKQKKLKEYEEVVFKGVNEIAKYFDELWVRTSDIRSDEFQNLFGAPEIKEANPMLGMHGIRYGIKHPEILKSELNALKRVSENGKEIGVLLPQVISVDDVAKTKKILQEIKFSKAKIGVMIETPAAVQLIKDFCDEGIDFISFGTNDLTQYILAVDRGNKEVQYLYDEMHPAVLYQLGYVLRVAKRNRVLTSICGQAGSKKEMVKFLVERGIDSISVNSDVAKEISDYVEQIEKGTLKESNSELEKGLNLSGNEMSPKEMQEGEVTESEEKQQESKKSDGKLDIF